MSQALGVGGGWPREGWAEGQFFQEPRSARGPQKEGPHVRQAPLISSPDPAPRGEPDFPRETSGLISVWIRR